MITWTSSSPFRSVWQSYRRVSSRSWRKRSALIAATVLVLSPVLIAPASAHAQPHKDSDSLLVPGVRQPGGPWIVNDLPGMPAPFRGPLPVDTSRTRAQNTRVTPPESTPRGADDWSCRPTPQHPYPLILVHGTTDLPSRGLYTAAPFFSNAGFCVFAPSYGRMPEHEGVGGVAPIEQSAAELAEYIQRVLHATGASKVDILGHSEGGLMPVYYMNHLGGWRYVHKYVGLSPSLRGTDAVGFMRIPPLDTLIPSVLEKIMYPAVHDQLKGSDFLRKMHSRPLTHPSVDYTVITTRNDIVVTPIESQYFPEAPNTHRISIQDDVCPLDKVNHYSAIYDPITLNTALRVLDPSYTGVVPCGTTLGSTGIYVPRPL